MVVEVRRTDPNAKIPSPSPVFQGAYDLFSSEERLIPPGKSANISTGIAFNLPGRTIMNINNYPSNIECFYYLINTVISPGYEASIELTIFNASDTTVRIEIGAPLGFFYIQPIYNESIEEVQLFSWLPPRLSFFEKLLNFLK